MTFAPPRPRIIPELHRTPSRDRGPSTLHPAPAPAALVCGGLYFGHAVHRRRHGVHNYAEISDAGFDSQTARHGNSSARSDPLSGTSSLRNTAIAGQPARADEARGPFLALRALHPDDRHAIAGLGDAVGRGLPGRAVRGRAPSGDSTAERQPAYPALERAFLLCVRVLCPGPVAYRGGAIPRARPTRRRIRGDGVGVDPR